jgi:hydrogenase 3 maturation protease
MLSELSALLAGKRVLILGVGNRLRGDDAVGPLLVERLQGKVNVPLIIDATDFGSNIGDASIFDIDHVQAGTGSTHAPNLGLLFKVIPPEARPQVLVLGIQPGNIELGQGLSDPVHMTMESVERILIDSIEKKM